MPVIQIESIMNSYPLILLSADINALQPLTPGHSLIRVVLLNIPENNAVLDSLPFSS